jgi:hypothetical protein
MILLQQVKQSCCLKTQKLPALQKWSPLDRFRLRHNVFQNEHLKHQENGKRWAGGDRLTMLFKDLDDSDEIQQAPVKKQDHAACHRGVSQPRAEHQDFKHSEALAIRIRFMTHAV